MYFLDIFITALSQFGMLLKTKQTMTHERAIIGGKGDNWERGGDRLNVDSWGTDVRR